MKIAINTCYGGFSLSDTAVHALAVVKGVTLYKRNSAFYTDPEHQIYFTSRPDNRDDPDLIEVIEQLGAKANGTYASLKIVEIPDDVEWEIQEYDGNEWVAEKHRTWE